MRRLFIAAFRWAVLLVVLHGVPAVLAQTPGPRVLVRYDMEGLAGEDDWRMAAAWWPERYAAGQKLLADDVNAVVAGLFDGGASTVDVWDQHGSGNPGFDLPPQLLDHRARQIGRADTPRVEPGAYDAVAMVGMHAKTGSGGFMAHTGTFGIDMIVNGRSITETEFAGYFWGDVGIPVIFVSGDDRLRDDLLPVMPWLEYVVTKHAISPQAAELRPLDIVRPELREGAKRALEQRAKAQPLRVATPIRAAVRAVPPADLSALKDLPGSNYADGQVSFQAQSWDQAWRGLVALQNIAQVMGAAPIIDEILKRDPLWPHIERTREAGFWERWIALEAERAKNAAPRAGRSPRSN